MSAKMRPMHSAYEAIDRYEGELARLGRTLAADFGVNPATISRIARGIRRQEVPA